MAQQLKFPEWRDEARDTKYPFSDSATLTNGSVTLPKSLLLDARLYPIGGGPRVFLSTMRLSADRTVRLGISAEGTGELASTTMSLDDVPVNGELALEDAFGRPAGIFVSEEEALAALSAFPQGAHTFEIFQTEFVATVVVPQPHLGVRGFLLDDGNVIAGDALLVGEDGVVLREEEGGIRVDVLGDPLGRRKLCLTEENTDLGRYCPLLTINEIPPNENGNFDLLPSSNRALNSVLRIEPLGDGLQIRAVGLWKFQGAQ
jgi:hypothetical protein